MPFDLSQTQVMGRDGSARPWRYTVEPVLNPDGSVLTPGTVQTPTGVFIQITPEIYAELRDRLLAADKTEFIGWLYALDINDPDPLKRPQTWHVPVWAGQTNVVYLRIPAVVWNAPTGVPPAKIKTFLHRFWR